VNAHRAWAGEPVYPNERRLIVAARAGLAMALDGSASERALAAGALLDDAELMRLIGEAMSQPRGNDPVPTSSEAGSSA
jgi:hypothetical protein